jgi:hypothetical protein
LHFSNLQQYNDFLLQFKHRNGEKVAQEDHTEQEPATEQATEPVEEDRSSFNRNKAGSNRFTAKFNKNSKEEPEETEGEGKTEVPIASRSKLFAASERTPGIASHFVPKVKHVDENAPTTTSSTTLTTSTTTASVEESSTRKKSFGAFGKDLLSSIPIEDDVSALLPEGFSLKPETSSLGSFVQVSFYSNCN